MNKTSVRARSASGNRRNSNNTSHGTNSLPTTTGVKKCNSSLVHSEKLPLVCPPTSKIDNQEVYRKPENNNTNSADKPIPPPRRSRSEMKTKSIFTPKNRPVSDVQDNNGASPIIDSNLDRLKTHSDMEM